MKCANCKTTTKIGPKTGLCRPCYESQWAKQNRNQKNIQNKKWRDNNKQYAKEYYNRNKDQHKNKMLLNRYGISLEEYNDLNTIQGHSCAICKKPNNKKRKFSVDHCHKTKIVRGILCNNCNVAIGLLKENEDSFLNAINYLRRHK